MNATVCIAGGGPAGMMLAFLLARAGIDVVVLEKHADFFRDFRGDTIHPSTLQIMDELGLLDDLLQLPHSEISELDARIGEHRFRAVQFDRVPGRCKFVAFMPQWDFLNFLAERAHRFSTFRLMMRAEAVALIEQSDRIAAVRVRSPDGELTIAADLVAACDGRGSLLRARAGLHPLEVGAPIDVLWLRLSKAAGDPGQTFGNIVPGGILVAIDRREYYQCAFVIRKGGFAQIQQRGIDAFREDVATLAPFLRDRVHEIRSWDDVKLLTVRMDRLAQWYRAGLLCIGDAAHAMSPVGGVGINLAIQDAVAAANILIDPLRTGMVSERHLRAIQRRRELPARVTQWLQTQIQNRVVNRVLNAHEPLALPRFGRALDRYAALRRVPAWIIGVGVRSEHVDRRYQKPSTSA